MDKKQATDNLQFLINVCIKQGNIFDSAAAVIIIQQSLEILAVSEVAKPMEAVINKNYFDPGNVDTGS